MSAPAAASPPIKWSTGASLTKRNSIVGVGVPDDPSEKSDLDGLFFPHTELPPNGGRAVEDASPYIRFPTKSQAVFKSDLKAAHPFGCAASFAIEHVIARRA